MNDLRKPAFDGVRAVCPKNPFNDPMNVQAFNNLLDAFGAPVGAKAPPLAVPSLDFKLTMAGMLEILEHEGIVLEAYKDSVGVWTWGGGVTDSSGHKVARYKDNPASIERVLEVYEWLLRTVYMPDVVRAFRGHALSEAQVAAALSFHWNTGAIGSASWVASYKAGKIDQAKAEFLNWSKPKEIIARRKLERSLFFDGIWSSDGLITVYERVRKPSYAPDWGSAKQHDLRAQLAAVVERAGA